MKRFLPSALAAAFCLFVPASLPAAVLQADLGDRVLADNQGWRLDVDGDGRDDLYLRDYYSHRRYWGRSYSDSEIRAYGLGGTRISAGGALAAGTEIGARLGWTGQSRLADRYSGSIPGGSRYSGSWVRSGASVTGHLGFALDGAGGTHYGWLNLTVDGDGRVTLHGMAWEDVACLPIVAGRPETPAAPAPVPLPASAGLIALGLAAQAAAGR
ncbi:hypothetical protein, partial [Mangrovicoccus algicola]